MNPDCLLKHFEQISEAPDAVPSLRRFILDLAVRGKLVEQNPADEPASELLKRIGANRAHGSHEGKRKNPKLHSPIEADEIAPQIPANWVLARVGELLDIQYGKALPAADRSDQGSVAVYGSNGVVGYCETALAREPAIIIGRKGSAGALNLCEGPSWTTDVAYFLIPPFFFSIRFLFVALQTLDLGSLGKGVKPGLNRCEAYRLPIVVPPLAEQHRIVAKADELMALCDELEAAQAKREKRRDRLVAATLHGLNNGDDSSEPGNHPTFEESACFYFNHLPRLTTRPEHIHQLRQTILNLAVRGKLVPQDTKDEPVDSLIAQIQGERVPRAIEGEPISFQASVDPGDTRYPIPQSWKWVRLGVVTKVLMGQSPPGETYNTRGEGIPLINGPVEFSEGPFGISIINQYTTAPTKLCKKGDLLVCVRGSTTGRTNVAGFDACIGRGVAALQPLYADQFVRLFIWSWRDQIIEMGRGIAFPSISRRQIEDLATPFPPLAEQHRIVARVEELMALCDELEAQLTTTATTCHQLLEATLSEAIAS